MKMIEGLGRPGETWHSTSLDFRNTDGDQLWMLYEVIRGTEMLKDRPDLPHRTLGVKEIEVENWDRFGRPTGMRGSFCHAALPNTPLFRGTTIFKRSSYKQRVGFFQRHCEEREKNRREVEEQWQRGKDEEDLDRAA